MNRPGITGGSALWELGAMAKSRAHRFSPEVRERSGPTSGDAVRLAALERENRELKRANDILRKASAFFAAAGCPLRELDRLTR